LSLHEKRLYRASSLGPVDTTPPTPTPPAADPSSQGAAVAATCVWSGVRGRFGTPPTAAAAAAALALALVLTAPALPSVLAGRLERSAGVGVGLALGGVRSRTRFVGFLIRPGAMGSCARPFRSLAFLGEGGRDLLLLRDLLLVTFWAMLH
jgi:hypothetical protein